MGHKKIVHNLQLEKTIRPLDPFVQIWQPSRNILQNHHFHEFSLWCAKEFLLENQI